MDPYDKEKTREIWKRVLGDECCEVRATDSEKLRSMIAAERTAACVLQKWARWGFSDALRCVAAEEQRHSRALETVYYLWTGMRAPACAEAMPRYAGMAQMLRAMHSAKREAAAAYRQAAEELPEYCDVLRSIAAEEEGQAVRFFRLLQRCVAQ